MRKLIPVIFAFSFGLGFWTLQAQDTRERVLSRAPEDSGRPALPVFRGAPSEQTVSCPVPAGHYDYCRLCGPCGEGKGDCDSDSDCGSGLVCGADLGSTYGFGSFVDVCVPRSSCPVSAGHPDYCALCGPCAEEIGDCDSDAECVAGLTCLADSGSQFGFNWNVDVCVDLESACPLAEGDLDYCSVCGPCEDEQGDCDSNQECESGLFCISDAGGLYGFASYVDVCIEPDSSGCPVSEGHVDYCALCGPCEADTGDCDGDEECESGLICVNNSGSLGFGWTSGTDVCMEPMDAETDDEECPLLAGHYDYCALCGPCEEDEGDCDDDSDCASGLVCMSDVGSYYDWGEDLDVCRIPGDEACPEDDGSYDYCGICGPCEVGQGDCDSHDECADGLVCVVGAGPSYAWASDVDVCLAQCPVPLGDPLYCSLCGPCDEGQGGCRSDEECSDSDLTCVPGVGELFGLPDDAGVCVSGNTCVLAMGEYGYCGTCGPCGEGEGDCDSDSQCETGLKCVPEAGADYGWAWDVDVCEPRSAEECEELLGLEGYCAACGPCGEGKGDCDSDDDCLDGYYCDQNVGDEYGWDPTIDVCKPRETANCEDLEGDWDYCDLCGPCDLGQGDCDSDDECRTGLTCAFNVGDDYGLDPELDVCQVDEECPDLLGDNSFCSVCGPCIEGQGDCDGDAECSEGLVCVNNVGAFFGWDWELDVCMAPATGECPVPRGHYDFCSLCGPCAEGAGDCDSDSDCASGLICGEDKGALYGLAPDVDVCRPPSAP